MDKCDVNGPTATPVFAYLKQNLKGTFGNFIKWNFTKFVVDRSGVPHKRYGPKDSPFSFEDTLRKLLAVPEDHPRAAAQ